MADTNQDPSVEKPYAENRCSTGKSSEQGELPKIVSFDDLARCGNEVWIRNRGQLYRLQQTRQGKLILTK